MTMRSNHQMNPLLFLHCHWYQKLLSKIILITITREKFQKIPKKFVSTRVNFTKINFYFRSLSEYTQEGAQPFFWISSLNSKNGKDAIKALGGNTMGTPQLIVCVPSERCRTPTIIERFQGVEINHDDVRVALERMRHTVDILKTERTQLLRNRCLIKEQEEQLQEMLKKEKFKDQASQTDIDVEQFDLKSSSTNLACSSEKERDFEKEIVATRMIRKSRITCEPPHGNVIRLRGRQMQRIFSASARFQEVYDWAGSMSEMPLHFTLHRSGPGAQIVQPDDSILGSETLDLIERPREDIASLLGSVVSFAGNYNYESSSPTVVEERLHQEQKIRRKRRTNRTYKQKKAAKKAQQKDSR